MKTNIINKNHINKSLSTIKLINICYICGHLLYQNKKENWCVNKKCPKYVHLNIRNKM